MNTPWGDTEELRTLRLPPGRGSLGPAAWSALKRRRFFASLVAALSERSYAELTIPYLEQASGLGREEFYRVFRSKEDCLLEAVDGLHTNAFERTKKAFVTAPGAWRERVEVGFVELLGLLDSQPDAARMGVVEIYAAGEPGARSIERHLSRFQRLLRQAYREAGSGGLAPGLISAQVTAIHMFLHDRLRRDERRLSECAEQLVSWLLSHEASDTPLRRPRRPVALPPIPRSPNPSSGSCGPSPRSVPRKG